MVCLACLLRFGSPCAPAPAGCHTWGQRCVHTPGSETPPAVPCAPPPSPIPHAAQLPKLPPPPPFEEGWKLQDGLPVTRELYDTLLLVGGWPWAAPCCCCLLGQHGRRCALRLAPGRSAPLTHTRPSPPPLPAPLAMPR